MLEQKNKDFWVSLILRVGLALVFLYPAISAIIDPIAWVGFIPSFISSIINPVTFLHIHSVIELILVVWFISGWKNFYPSVIAAIFALTIVLTNLGAFALVFRDIAIIFMAIALAVLSWKGKDSIRSL